MNRSVRLADQGLKPSYLVGQLGLLHLRKSPQEEL